MRTLLNDSSGNATLWVASDPNDSRFECLLDADYVHDNPSGHGYRIPIGTTDDDLIDAYIKHGCIIEALYTADNATEKIAQWEKTLANEYWSGTSFKSLPDSVQKEVHQDAVNIYLSERRWSR